MPATTYNYISLISLLLDDEINPKAIDIYNHEGLTDVMGIMGRYEKSKQPVYHNYANADLALQLDTTGATVTGSGTATITNTTATIATSGYTRKGLLVKFPNGKVGVINSYTTASSQDSMVIKSIDGTNLTHTAGQKLDVFSTVVGEKSTAPDNRRYPLTKYVNKTQLFREINSETDIAKQALVRVNWNGKNVFYAKNLIEKMIQHRASVNGALIGGYLSTDSFSDSTLTVADPIAGGAMQTTRGLDQYITTYGVSDAVASAGTWTLADHSDVIDQLIARRADISSYMMMMPSKVKGKVDDALLNLGSSGVTSMRLNREAGGKGNLNFEVQEFKYKGMTATMMVLPILDHNKMFSQTDIVKSIYYMPKGNVKNMDNSYQNRIQIRYQDHGVAQNKGDNIWGEWHTGGQSPVPGGLTAEAVWDCHWLTNQGLEVLGAEHFCKSVVLA